MVKRAYRAYCRSAAQMSCNPWIIGAGIIVVFAISLGAGKLRGHGHGIMHVLDSAGAFALTLVAAGLAVWAVRTVAAAAGHHADPATLPVAVPAQAKPVPVPATRPVPAPAELPVTGVAVRPAPGFARAVTPDPEAAAMAADADALRDRQVTPVVTAGGILYETARREP